MTDSSDQRSVTGDIRVASSCAPDHPAVLLSWGDQSGVLSPDEAIAHALGIIEAAVVSRVDSAVVKLLVQSLGLDIKQAVEFVGHIGHKRSVSDPESSITLWLDDKPVTPAEAIATAKTLLAMAFDSEAEYWFCNTLIQDMNLTPNQANAIIQDLREARGAVTPGEPPSEELVKRKRPEGFGSGRN